MKNIFDKIVLIGYRGAGKTTVAEELSRRLGWDSISTDRLIESKHQLTINQIVAQEGWESFRKTENQVIREVSASKNVIIDCGGGVVENSENMMFLQKNSLIVWIKAEEDDLFKRLSKVNDRPLLSALDLRQDIKQNYHRRIPLYKKYSRLVVNTSLNSKEEVCSKILNFIQCQYSD
jgi:shikimate kinase